MKASLATITVLGLTAALALATPGRDLNKRRAEKKRDNAPAEVSAPAQPETAPSPSPSSPSAPAAPATSTPPAAPEASTSPSPLIRDGKPPSHRFFSRIRTDSSRHAARAKLDAARSSADPDATAGAGDLIYRETWGTRSRRRPR